MAQLPYNFLRRVPGMDVAMGVTAYQVASSIKTAVAAAGRGGEMVEDIAGNVGELVRWAVVSVLNDLARTAGDIQDAVGGAAYGAVLGAGEMGADVVQAATQAIAGAKEAAGRLGLSEEEAAAQAVQGALQAAETLDPRAAARLKDALGKQRPDGADGPDA